MPLVSERLYDDLTTTRLIGPGSFFKIFLLALGLLVLVVGVVLHAMTGQASGLLAFGFLLLAFGVVLLVGSLRRSRHGDASPNRACPKCGTPPEGEVTANGFTKCPRCGEPFFVS